MTPSRAARPKAVSKYLDRFAERESLDVPTSRQYGAALIIPSYGEGDGILPTLASIPVRAEPTWVVLVVNERSDSEPDVVRRNTETLEAIASTHGARVPDEGRVATTATPFGDLCVVRRTGAAALPRDQGVGLARKIGTDIALRVWSEGNVRSPFLHFTDADARLPPDYFEQAGPLDEASTAAAVYPFRHEPRSDRACALYECWLRYYVLGLRRAGSPYDHHSIGSTIAVHAIAYAEVRGVPRVRAAEDFHFLDKLAKTGSIVSLPGQPLVLSARVSTRVPFGTGAAVGTWAQEPGARRFYDPVVFDHLRSWLRAAEAVLTRGTSLDEALRQELDDGSLADIDRIATVVARLDLLRRLEQIPAVSRNPNTRMQHFHTHFGGLLTLRFIHALRDAAYPSLSLHEAMARRPFGIDLDTGDLDAIRDALEAREASTDPRGYCTRGADGYGRAEA